jgi:hypothetical protein
MTTLTTAWMLGCVCGFFLGVTVASGRRRPRGNGNCVPLPPAPPYSSAAIARRGSNPPPPGRKPAPPAGPPVRFDEGQTQRGNGSGGPLPPAPPYSSAAIAWQAEAEASRANFIDPSIQRIYRGAMWREKGSDVWHPIGKEPDWADLARQQLNRTTPPPREP